MVHPDSHGIPRVPRYSGSCPAVHGFDYGGITRCAAAFQRLRLPLQVHLAVPQPRPASRPVWPGPRSLVATEGIAIAFSSSGYLDISVHRVDLAPPMDSGTDTWVIPGGFPHSEIPGSKPVWRLPEAYRSLPRPSSSASAKASTVRP